MNENIRKILKRLIDRYGISLADDPGRCEGLLRDTCENGKKEIFLLSNAARLHIPHELTNPRHLLPYPLIKGFLAKRLEDERGFSHDASIWTVDCWAEALGIQDPTGVIKKEPDNRAPQVPAESLARSRDPVLLNQWSGDLTTAPRSSQLLIVSHLAQVPGEESCKLLIRTLKNDDPVIRTAAFEALCTPSLQAAGLLIKALDQPDDAIVGRAALALGILKEKRAGPHLIRQLKRSSLVVGAVAWALGELEYGDAIAPLMELLPDPDERVAFAAADALKKIGSH
ncbi:MAG: HEAT repeat domain-containing protein [Methanoregula sp.]|jgi:hypothetical protein